MSLVKELKYFPNLEIFEIRGCGDIKDISKLKEVLSLTNLKKFTIKSCTKLTKLPREIKNLINYSLMLKHNHLYRW